MNKSRKKKIIIISIVVVLIAAISVGAVFIKNIVINNKGCEVIPVSYIADTWYTPENMNSSGIVISGDYQAISINDNLLVKEINVKVGDAVKVGDVLLTYDTDKLQLDVAEKKNNISIVQVNINNAEKELAELKSMKPSEDMPAPPTEPITEPTTALQIETLDKVSSSTAAISGNGTEKSPLSFNCNFDTIVEKAFMEKIAGVVNENEPAQYAVLNIYSDNMKIAAISINPQKIDVTDISGFSVSEVVFQDEYSNLIVEPFISSIGRVTLYSQDNQSDIPESYTEDESFTTYDNFTASTLDYMYSRTELAQMITEKQNEISKLYIDKRQAELDYEKAENSLIDGNEVAKIDGTVKTAVDITSSYDISMPLVEVSGDMGGSVVQGSISELNLDSVTIGTEISAIDYETGMTYFGTISEISDIPQTNSDYYYGYGNPNSSYYPFKANLQDAGDLAINSYLDLSITPTSQNTEQPVIIQKAYVREENGNNYVMVANENNRLEKRYVKTGAIIYGSEITIKSGLSLEDRIAFPYGKNVKEGVKIIDSDMSTMW